MIKVIVNGAEGRMGKLIAGLVEADAELTLAGKADAGRERISAVASLGDVIIDFSSHEAVAELLPVAQGLGKPLVIGTTGHTPEELVMIKKASQKLPIVFSPNMSVGVNLLWKLAEIAGKTLNSDYDVRIEETHHIHKKDAPSGTAKKLAEIIAKTFKKEPAVRSKREGEVVGDHILTFESEGDVIELSHFAKSREIFAKGALQAAKWVVGKPAGLYTMQDVLF